MSIPVNKYPYTDLHEMNMDYVLEQIKQLVEAWAQTQTEWTTMQDDFATLSGQFTDLKNYVDNYFDNLDVQQEINNKLDQMALDGTLTAIIQSIVVDMYDTVPTQDSMNPITSGGVWQAIKDVTDAYTNMIQDNNMNPITSDAIHDAFLAVGDGGTPPTPGSGVTLNSVEIETRGGWACIQLNFTIASSMSVYGIIATFPFTFMATEFISVLTGSGGGSGNPTSNVVYINKNDDRLLVGSPGLPAGQYRVSFTVPLTTI